MLSLVTTYDDSIKTICGEIADCEAGDQIVFSLYIWEPGVSSTQVLKALETAAQKNIKIIFDIDHSYIVKFARFIEKTETFIGELMKFAEKYPNTVSFSNRLRPNHKKYYLFKRQKGSSALIFGGMNLGDRFADWKDFLVVFKSNEIGEYIYDRFVLDKSDAKESNSSVKIIANEPEKKIFQIEPTLSDLLQNTAFNNYKVTTPYIDQRGVELLKKALEHNAKIQLIIPAHANIYQNANMRTLRIFSRFEGATIYLYKKMIHAKTILATGDKGQLSFIGSANMKKKSFNTLGEFNALISDQVFCQKLSAELDAVIADCKILDEPMPYKKIMSRIEEFLG